MRGLGRDEHKTGHRWGPLPCTLQGLEADVCLLPTQIPARLLIPISLFPVSQLGRVGPYGAHPKI